MQLFGEDAESSRQAAQVTLEHPGSRGQEHFGLCEQEHDSRSKKVIILHLLDPI